MVTAKVNSYKKKNSIINESLILSKDEFLLLKNKDTVIITKIFTVLKDYIYKFIYYRTGGNTDETDEIFCDSTESFLKYVPKIKYNKNMKNLWIKITSGKISDFYKRKRKQIKIIDNIKEKIEINHSENSTEYFDLEQAYFIYNIVLEKLNKNYKEILLLKYKENRTLDEICKILSCRNKKSAKNTLFRAKKALVTEMNHYKEKFL